MLIKSILAFFIISTILVSCNQKEKVEADINSYTNTVYSTSRKNAYRTIREILDDIERKMHKPETRDTAYIYKPKADSVVALGENMIEYLDTLLSRINNNGKLEEKDSLPDKLKIFEATLAKNDPRNDVFEKSILDIDTLIGFKNINKHEFNSKFLKDASRNQTIAILHSLEEDVLNTEIRLLYHIDYYNCGSANEYYDKYCAIITQNSEQLLPNNTLEITAGIGRFEYHPNAKFTVGNKEIPITDSTDGIAIYKMKVSDKKGRHTIRTKISWKKPNGEPIELEKEIVYYVE